MLKSSRKPSKEIQQKLFENILKHFRFEGANMLFPYKVSFCERKFAKIEAKDIRKIIKYVQN